MFKLFIFDLDGTLINSVPRWADLFERTLEHVQICVPRGEVVATFGESAENILKTFVKNGKTKEATNFFMNHQMEHISQFEVFNHSRAILRDLKAKGHLVAIATGNKRRFMKLFLERFGLKEFVDYAVCSDDVKNDKPAPDLLLKVLNHFNTTPQEAIYIADSPMDLKSARSANMKIAIVTTGVLSKEQAKELQADYIFSDLREIERLF